MSYAMAGALQTAIYGHLVADAQISTLVGTAIYDALPVGELPETCVLLGTEDTLDRSSKTSAAAEHRLVISVVTSSAGFARAKLVAAAICDALDAAELSLNRGALIGLWFQRAAARRTGPAGRLRRIDMRFRAIVEDN